MSIPPYSASSLSSDSSSLRYAQPPGSGPRSLGILLVLASCVMAGYLWLVHNAELWPSTSAEIAATRIESHWHSSRYGSYTDYKLYETFRYPAAGEIITREDLYGTYDTSSAASAAAAKINNTFVCVRYKDNDPKTMMCEERLQRNRVIAVPVALIMVACFLCGTILTLIGFSISATTGGAGRGAGAGIGNGTGNGAGAGNFGSGESDERSYYTGNDPYL